MQGRIFCCSLQFLLCPVQDLYKLYCRSHILWYNKSLLLPLLLYFAVRAEGSFVARPNFLLKFFVTIDNFYYYCTVKAEGSFVTRPNFLLRVSAFLSRRVTAFNELQSQFCLFDLSLYFLCLYYFCTRSSDGNIRFLDALASLDLKLSVSEWVSDLPFFKLFYS